MPDHKTSLSNHGIFFDVDDTLYDHLEPFRTAMDKVLLHGEDFPFEIAYQRMRYYSDLLSTEAGGTPTESKVIEEMRIERFVRTLAEFDMTLTKEQAAAIQAAYIDCQFRIRPFEGAEQLIRKLQMLGATVGLITNGPAEHQWKKIRILGIDRLIPADLIFISGAVGLTKPDPRLFEHVAAKLKLTAGQCCYIGDSWRNDVVGAAEAGWRMLWFNHRGVQPESQARPHEPAASYTELSRLLLGE